MDELFGRVRAVTTMYTPDVEDINPRFVLAIFGEDAALVVQQCSEETPGDFLPVPVFAYNAVPRRQLCSQRSLSAALAVVDLQVDSIPWKQWRELAEEFGCAWPKRLSRLNSPETKPKAA